MEWETNSTILQRLHDYGARTVWANLDACFHVPLVRLAERSGLGHDQAQDVVQETLLTFAEAYRAGRYEPGRARLRSWLFGIARVLIRQAREETARREREDARVGAPDEPDDAAESELESLWEAEWRRSILERATRIVRAEVTDESFEVFRLRSIEGLASQEVAERLSIPVGRVYNTHSRVLQRLASIREALDDA